ncbi:hypothetical protein H9P43_001123 [Blastocladiella emersonii ATCC 22665]|nr:hypothetical protein H9P43_001123 [Blastocladiella emersonii ATCC 22665]
MTSYEVMYFPATGRAEIIRLVLEAAGATYTNKYPKDWPAEKASLPFGQLPALVIKADGKEETVAQTSAIVRYLAKKHGLVPESEHELFIADSLAESVRDVMEAMITVVWRTPEDKKEQAKADLKEKTIPAFVKAHEKFLAANGNNGYYFGSKLTYIELAVFNLVEGINSVVPGSFTPENAAPILKVSENVKNLPRIKEYLASPRFHK